MRDRLILRWPEPEPSMSKWFANFMVFLVQSTQNRDAGAIHIKLDEIISTLDQASNRVIGAEDETEEELKREKQRYTRS